MLDITRKRGDTYAEEFQLVNETDGLPIDISTGYSFLLTVDPEKSPVNSDNNLFQIVGVIVDGANGIVEFTPTLSDSDQEPATYYYDAQVTYPSGRIRTFEDGKWKVLQDITK